MKTNKTIRAIRVLGKARAAQPAEKRVLRLYVAGATERSRQAVMSARQLCEAEENQNFELEVIDVYQQPILARGGRIVATPTLVREFPPPVRRLIGDLTNANGLFVVPKPRHPVKTTP